MNTNIARDAHVADSMFGVDSFKIDEGVGATGVRTVLHFMGATMVIEKQQDMEPILAHVREMRERNALRPFASDKELGHIPEIFYQRIRLIRDRDERKKAVRRFFKEHPVFCAYDPVLRG